MKRYVGALKFVILLLSVISILSLVSAGNIANITLVTPGASGTVGGTYVLNATYNGTDSRNVTCIFYARSTSTANDSWSNLGSEINRTYVEGAGSLSVCNLTIDLYGYIEDANNYDFNVTIINSTNGGSVVNTGVTVDYTTPQIATSLSPTSLSVDADGSVAFSGTMVGRNTTSCTLFFTGIHPGATSYAMTHSGNSCTYTHSSMPSQTYTWYIRGSDGTNTSDTSNQQITVDIQTSSGKTASLYAQQNLKSIGGKEFVVVGNGLEGKWMGMPIWLVVLLIIAIVFFVIKFRR